MTLLVGATLIGIIIGSIMLGLAIETLINHVCMSRERIKYGIRELIAGILVVILAASFMSIIMINSDTEMQQNSKLVITAEFDNDMNIYQEYDTGKYFRICSTDWDLLNPQHREYINGEEAEDIIKALKILNEWND